MRQDHPLRAGHSAGTRALVGARAHLPGNIEEEDEEFGVEGDLHGPNLKHCDNKLRYYFCKKIL